MCVLVVCVRVRARESGRECEGGRCVLIVCLVSEGQPRYAVNQDPNAKVCFSLCLCLTLIVFSLRARRAERWAEAARACHGFAVSLSFSLFTSLSSSLIPLLLRSRSTNPHQCSGPCVIRYQPPLCVLTLSERHNSRDTNKSSQSVAHSDSR